MSLRLSSDLSLPIDVAGEAIGMLASRGAGKSYTSAALVEELWAANVQLAVLDPTGVYWGLRASADGKGKGLPIIVLGGPRGDLPLEATAGALIADVLVDTGQSLILDLSDFPTKGTQTRFVADFAERLYRRKARSRTTLHLVIDEADEFAPQKVVRDGSGFEARMLGAMEVLVRRGRSRGIGTTLITQRSATLNKNVLDVIDTLIALRMGSPRDRKVIEQWVTAKDLRDELGVLDSLPGLPTGTAWVWSPKRQILQQTAMRRIKTFDSYRTPKPGESVTEPGELAPIDLAKLGKQIEATAERAKETDPKELQKKVRELERQLKQLESQNVAQEIAQEIAVERVEVPVEVRVEIPVFPEETLLRVEALVQKASGPLTDLLSEAQELAGVAKHGRERLYELLDAAREGPKSIPKAAGAVGPSRKLLPTPAAPAPSFAEEVKLKKGARRMLEVLARMADLGPLTRQQLGTLAGLSARGGTFSDYLSSLRRGGYIVDAGEHVQITEIGLKFAGDVSGPVTTEELVGLWQGALKAGARRMLDVLVEAYPAEMTRQELAEASGVVSSGGTFSDYLSSLRRNGLLDESGGSVRANPSLFMGDAA